MAWPLVADAKSPSKVTIRSTVDVFPDGNAVTRCPTRNSPAANVPAKPRKSRLGRFTY